MNDVKEPSTRVGQGITGEPAGESIPGHGNHASSISTDQKHSARYVWYVIVLLSAVNAFNYMDRMALAVLAPLIKVDLQLSDAQLGLLVGFAFFLFYAICGIPIARWADRGVRRNIIVIALATWSVMTALSGAVQNFWHLLVVRVGIGVGEAGCIPPSQSIICDYVPLKRRSGSFAIHAFGLYAGIMIGMVMAGWLGETIGWRWSFAVLGLPGIAMAVIVRLTLVEPARGTFDAVKGDESRLPFGKTVGLLWGCKTYRVLVLFLVVNGFVQYGLNQWWPSFYARVLGLSLSTVGLYLGIAIGAGSGVGLLIGGLLANRLAQRDIRLPLIVGAAATSLALPAALGALFVSSAPSSILLLSLTGLFWSLSNGPVTATLYSVTMPHMRATAGALAIFVTSVLGMGLGPFCVGLLSDILAPLRGIEALRYALLLPIGLLPVMVIALCAAAKSSPSDLRAAGTQFESVSTDRVNQHGGCGVMIPAVRQSAD